MLNGGSSPGSPHVKAIRSPALAAVLSFVVPGLGQLYLGRVRRAALVVMPAIFGVVLVAVAGSRASGYDLADLVLDPTALAVLFVVNVAIVAYRLVAIVDAWLIGVRQAGGREGTTGGPGTVATVVLAVLLVATVGMHGYAGYLDIDANATLDSIFPAGGGGQGAGIIPPASFGDVVPPATPATTKSPAAALASPSHRASGPPGPSTAASGTPSGAATPAVSASPTSAPSATPQPTQVPDWATDGRLNLLLVGADAGPDRWSLRTDTMILLSVDAKSGRAALFGIPRNLIGVPLAPESAGASPNGRFPGLLNALYVYAAGHPNSFPGGDNRGYRAVAGAVQQLMGVPLDGMVVINLAGFVQLVDALGGLWIDIASPLFDGNYPLEDGSGYITLNFSPGCQHLNGRMALAYARSRHQDFDYGRMRRQQTVLLALRRQVDPVSIAPRVPSLLDIARNNLWSTIKRSDVLGLAKLAATVDVRRIVTVLFTPPGYSSHLSDAEIARIHSVVRGALAGPLPPPAPLPSGSSCR